MRALLLLLVASGCSGTEPAPPSEAGVRPAASTTDAGGPAGGVGGPAGGPGGPRSADPIRAGAGWRADLALPVPELNPPPEGCPDADGDGFADGWRCPALSPAQADCDDGDPAVTPETERMVRPGPFVMGDGSPEAGWDERPVHAVFLSAYCLDRREASGGQVAAWMTSAGVKPSSLDARNPAPGLVHVEPDRPAEGLTRDEAAAFCAQQGKRLPTEAQWEKAARGGCELGTDPARCDPDDLRTYPWGDAPPTCDRAWHRVTGPRGPVACGAGTLPVDHPRHEAGAGPYGHLALAGNVWEWVADRYHPATYVTEPRRNPSGPAEGALGTLRGGSWSTFSTNMRVANRMSDLVLGSASGVRCARFDHGLNPDAVKPLRLVTLQGTVRRADGAPLAGRAVYVTAFDARDLDPNTGRLVPGRSPMAERRFETLGDAVLAFELPVPQGGSYKLSAALDAGTGAGVAPSGSGGMGELDGLVDAARSHTNLELVLRPAPGGPP